MGVQERLTQSESRFAVRYLLILRPSATVPPFFPQREMEAASGKSTCQIAVLEEQNSSLGTKLADLEATMRVIQEAGSAVRVQYEEKLSTQEEVYRLQLASGQQRVDDSQKALEDARLRIKGLEQQVETSKQDITALREELREAKLPSPVHKEALDALAAELTALRADNTELVLRARTIDARYRTGDLV